MCSDKRGFVTVRKSLVRAHWHDQRKSHRRQGEFQGQNRAQQCAGSRDLRMQAWHHCAFKFTEFRTSRTRSERASICSVRRQSQNHQRCLESQNMDSSNASLVDSGKKGFPCLWWKFITGYQSWIFKSNLVLKPIQIQPNFEASCAASLTLMVEYINEGFISCAWRKNGFTTNKMKGREDLNLKINLVD